MQTALQAALAQLSHYRRVLAAKYQQPERLRCIAVVALGFDRVIWQELDYTKPVITKLNPPLY